MSTTQVTSVIPAELDAAENIVATTAHSWQGRHFPTFTRLGEKSAPNLMHSTQSMSGHKFDVILKVPKGRRITAVSLIIRRNRKLDTHLTYIMQGSGSAPLPKMGIQCMFISPILESKLQLHLELPFKSHIRRTNLWPLTRPPLTSKNTARPIS